MVYLDQGVHTYLLILTYVQNGDTRFGLSMSKFQIIGKHWKRSETSSTSMRCMRKQQML